MQLDHTDPNLTFVPAGEAGNLLTLTVLQFHTALQFHTPKMGIRTVSMPY